MNDLLAPLAPWFREADGLLISAGAGMSIDAGLPDFRGPGGFWAVYPALGRARIAFESIANPAAFECDPRLAWGFYGHRLECYRHTAPHAGYAMLLALADRLPHGAFVFTSNVDGHFQQAGFPPERICEVHGSIHHLQCMAGCSARIWTAEEFVPQIDAEACRLLNDPPHCAACGNLARPNILMFGDGGWIERRTEGQFAQLQQWLASVERPLCIEIGAGTHIATVRTFSETYGWRLLRINPNECDVPDLRTGLGLPIGGLAGITALMATLGA